ncbi:MAG: alpha/beta fold hydrolase [Cyanobacteria bacterium P01_F01_bin.42]
MTVTSQSSPSKNPDGQKPNTSGVQSWTWRGFNLRYRVEGEGTPLILLHGFGASLDHWRKNIPTLAESYRVYAIDLLGFGQSEKPAMGYSLELWERMLWDFLEEIIQEPAFVVGNSIGALLSLMMIAHKPDICLGGILLNVAGGLNHRPEELNPPLRVMMGTFSKVMSLPIVGNIVFNQVRRRSQIKRTLRQVYGNREAVTDELVEYLYQPSCDQGAQKVMAAILTAPPGPKVEELLPSVRKPLLVLWGEADPWTPIAASQQFQDAVDNPPHPDAPVQFQAIPETGHCPHDERPEIVNEAILNWLSELA